MFNTLPLLVRCSDFARFFSVPHDVLIVIPKWFVIPKCFNQGAPPPGPPPCRGPLPRASESSQGVREFTLVRVGIAIVHELCIPHVILHYNQPTGWKDNQRLDQVN